MRVAFLLPAFYDFPIGGYRIVYQHANALAERGHDVTVVIPRDLTPSRALTLPQRMKRLLWPMRTRLRHRPLVDWQPIDPRVRLRLVGFWTPSAMPDADVVVATAWQTAAPVAELAPRKGRKFYLLQDYEVWQGATADEVDATFRLPLTVLAISRWLADLARDKGARRVVHTPNALDLELFRVTRAPLEARPPAVLSLWHEDPRKDAPLALSVLERFHALRPQVPVTLFGVPARPAELPEWIAYVERPRQQALADLYNAHSIYLAASRKEGSALPPAEAMACGCAFVGTDIGGFREFAEPDVTARLVPVGDADALLAELLHVADDASLRRRLQTAGATAIAGHTWTRAGDAMAAALADGSGPG